MKMLKYTAKRMVISVLSSGVMAMLHSVTSANKDGEMCKTAMMDQ